MGKILESSLRTMNNLLERLHASFFFFLLVRPEIFMKIGMYLPSAILVGTAMLFSGLCEWVNAGWLLTSVPSVDDEKSEKTQTSSAQKWVRRDRHVLGAVTVMVSTHAVGYVLFEAVSRRLVSLVKPRLIPLVLTFGVGQPNHPLSAVCSHPFASCTPASAKPSRKCTSVYRPKGTKLVPYLGSYLYHSRAQLLTCRRPRRVHGYSTHFRILVAQSFRPPCEVHSLLCSWPGLACILSRGDSESDVELGGVEGVARAIRVRSVCAIGAPVCASLLVAIMSHSSSTYTYRDS